MIESPNYLRILLWKNFVWCKRHPIRTLMFYAVPLLLCYMLTMVLEDPILNIPDCDYESVVLPPSHPALLVTSLVCQNANRCVNRTSNQSVHVPVEQWLNWYSRLTNDETLQPSVYDEVANKTYHPSYLCPGRNHQQEQAAFVQAMLMACDSRDSNFSSLFSRRDVIDYVFRGRILYYPNDATTRQIVQRMTTSLDQIRLLKIGILLGQIPPSMQNGVTQNLFKLAQIAICYDKLSERVAGFDNRADAMKYATNTLNNTLDLVWGMIEFNVDDESKKVDYKLVTEYSTRNSLSTLYLQSLTESGIVEHFSNKTEAKRVNIAQKLLPKRCHKDPAVYNYFITVVLSVVSVGMIPMVYSVAGEICYEKSAGLLEFLLIAGVSRFKVKLSWLIFSCAFVLSVHLIVSFIFLYSSDRVFEHVDKTLFVFVFLMHGLALVGLCFTVSSIISSAQQASVSMLTIVMIGFFAPRWGGLIPNIGYSGTRLWFARITGLLHPTIAIFIGASYFVEWEVQERALGWDNIFVSPVEEDGIKGMAEISAWMTFQTIVYLFLSWYFDYVAPSKYGYHYPWYFFLQKSFWDPLSERDVGKETAMENGNVHEKIDADVEPLNYKPAIGITIENLTKTYARAKKSALDHLTVNFYKNEITAFLGHNGAGKSTTMNMLTGMLYPTSGTARIGEHSIWSQMKEIREALGFCPQYDIVYPELTVNEHMQFFGKLKGLSEMEIVEYSKLMFTQMQMYTPEQMNRAARNLSGGMKRKLSIAVSFLGAPDTVILDEPTSAIDPFSRRAIWDLILHFKDKATILLSTHYMQEADVLGDRIAVIQDGVLQTFGTSMYLKSRYGAGSELKLAHRRAVPINDIYRALAQHATLEIKNSSETESVFSISHELVQSPAIVKVFETLEENKDNWHIDSFGITESTLEQVFFKIGAEKHVNSNKKLAENNDMSANGTTPTKIGYKKYSGLTCLALSFVAMISKRFKLAFRSVLGLTFQVFMPLLLAGVMLFLNNLLASTGFDGKQIGHTVTDVTFSNTLMFYNGPMTDTWSIALSSGFGNKCSVSTCSRNQSEAWPETSSFVQTLSTSPVSCNCKFCPSNANGRPASRLLLPSGELALNLNHRNVTDFLLKTEEKYFIGGISHANTEFADAVLIAPFGLFANADLNISLFQAVIDFDARDFEQLQRPERNTDQGTGTVQNTTAQQTAAPTGSPQFTLTANQITFILKQQLITGQVEEPLSSYLNLFIRADEPLYTLWSGLLTRRDRAPNYYELNMRYMRMSFVNAFINLMVKSVTEEESASITLATEETTFVGKFSIVELVNGIILGLFSSFALLTPVFNVLNAIVSERASGNKQLQYIMGLNPFIYWMANFVWDLAMYALSVAILLTFMMYNSDVFDVDFEVFFKLCMVYCLGMILAAYVTSFAFSTSRIAIIFISITSVILAIFALVINAYRDKDWFDTVNNATQLFPPYFLTSSLTTVAFYDLIPDWLFEKEPILSWDVLGVTIARCIGFSIIMLLTLVVLEFNLHVVILGLINQGRNLPAAESNKDPDVQNEANRIIKQEDVSDTLLTVTGLGKSYGSPFRRQHLAVKGVTFGVKRAECFGLLGVNGAGKTTLFQMLCGYHTPSFGDAKVLDHSIFTQASKVVRHMSYCPQHDVLFEQLTVKEHLVHYARLRGVPVSEVQEVIEQLIVDIGLDAHVSKQASALSGGNRRKLNFAISMIDYPDVIFLDEMTTGMDPKARRAAWNCLRKAVQLGCAIVITSHSMEECETLCNRLVIMVNGEFRCIGGVQYLKDKFGKAYKLKCRLSDTTNSTELQQHFTSIWPDCVIGESHAGYVEVSIPVAALKLSSLFETVHRTKEKFELLDFSVTQTSLEHVFVNMVKDQKWTDEA